MPTVSTFYGIKINMYYGDHAPPHFHVFVAEHEAKVAIGTSRGIAGNLPKTAQRLVRQWAILHQVELAQNWERATNDLPLHRIVGLT